MEDDQKHQAANPIAQPTDNRRAKPAKQSKKNTASPGKRSEPFDYASLGLEPGKLVIIEACVTEIATIGRRTTEQTFAAGDQLRIAVEFIPDRTFGKWVSAECEFTRQHAWTLINIATRLKPHKERLVSARVGSTVMGILAANPDYIEMVLGEFEAGRRLKVKEVEIIAGVAKPETATDLDNVGGIAGLRNLAKAKANIGIRQFAERLTAMIIDIEEALKPIEKGKRVLKGALAEKIEMPARFARTELENIALFIEPNALLWDLGGQVQWQPDLVPWLSEYVVPLLQRAIGKGPDRTAETL